MRTYYKGSTTICVRVLSFLVFGLSIDPGGSLSVWGVCGVVQLEAEFYGEYNRVHLRLDLLDPRG